MQSTPNSVATPATSGKYARTQEWVRLASAAMMARDELRVLASDLTVAMAAGSIPRALITRARDTSARHADLLRIAIKHPSVEPERRKYNRDMPLWMSDGQ